MCASLIGDRSVVLRVRRPLPQYVRRYRGRTPGCTGGEPSAFLQVEVKYTEPKVSGSARINASLDDCSNRATAERDPPPPTASIANRSAEANEPCDLSPSRPSRHYRAVPGDLFRTGERSWRRAAGEVACCQRSSMRTASPPPHRRPLYELSDARRGGRPTGSEHSCSDNTAPGGPAVVA